MAKVASRFIFLLCLSILLLFCASAVWSSTIPGVKKVPQFNHKHSSSWQTRTHASREVDRNGVPIFRSAHRGLLNVLNTREIKHDSINPPTTFPTNPTNQVFNPVTTPSVTVTPGNQSPAIVTPANPAPVIVTIPGTNPATGLPNPSTTPATIPAPMNPLYPPVPVTNPVTTPSNYPSTNPGTAYQPPSTQIIPGQTWCVARNGVTDAQLQSALDYACGIGGADCSAIQDGASCYNPNTLQNHASYAFNSYYQRNPTLTSCDFGGSAVITNINPSSGSCIYPLTSAASSSSSPAVFNPMPTPTTSSTPAVVNPVPTPTTSSSTGAAYPGVVTPPTAFSSGNPGFGTAAGFGGSPPIGSTLSSSSLSTCLQPFIGCLVLLTCAFTGRLY